MSKYRNHREPRRRGFDDDDSTQDPEPSYFQREPARAAVPVGSPSVDVEVVWFNVDKGFGFVKLADDSKAFLHVSALGNVGHRVVSEGMHLTVRVAEGQKGPQVAEVLAVSVGGPSPGNRRADTSDAGLDTSTPGEQKSGVVKRYYADKGFGFVGVEGSSKDAFVHVSVLKRSGLDILEEGQRVIIEIGKGPKGPEVRSLRLA